MDTKNSFPNVRVLSKKHLWFKALSYWAKFKLNRLPSFNLSHSQFGEDMVLRSLIGDKTDGFYIDIGAHHPIYYSNTFHFYCKGWRGVNIDALPGSMSAFRSIRPKDVNLEICVSDSEVDLDFYIFDQPALNTIDKKIAEDLIKSKRAKLIERRGLKAMTVTQILEQHLPPGQVVDILNIDLEGADEKIIKSIDWKKHRPRFIVFESHAAKISDLHLNPIAQFLKGQGYEVVAKCGPSLIAAEIL
ncbi:MAG: FkbM family methyltransferase [Oligoflexia bacterium]|nr:FkbM family methyltransferase [Oligoflexia bacterium]